MLGAAIVAPALGLPPPTGMIQFSSPAYSVGEADGFAVITLTRVGGTATEITATFQTSDGTAAAGADYTAVVQQVTFAHLDTTPKILQVPILEDAAVEGDETVVLGIFLNPAFPPTSGAVLTIFDNDQAIPALSGWGLVLLVAGLVGAAWWRLAPRRATLGPSDRPAAR